MPLISEFGRQKQKVFCDFFNYIKSFRLARVMWRDPASKNKQKKTPNATFFKMPRTACSPLWELSQIPFPLVAVLVAPPGSSWAQGQELHPGCAHGTGSVLRWALQLEASRKSQSQLPSSIVVSVGRILKVRCFPPKHPLFSSSWFS